MNGLKFLYVMSFFALLQTGIAQPANDNCADAALLTVGASCSMQAFTTSGATPQGIGIAPDPTCIGYTGNDVWFRFVVPASGKVRIETNNLGAGSAFYTLYSGNCGAFSEVGCKEFNPSTASPSNFNLSALSGQTVYMRVYRYAGNSAHDFELCVWELDFPNNDHCASATPLVVGETCLSQNFTSISASGESYAAVPAGEDTEVAPNPTCGGYLGADVWFTFVAPPTGQFRVTITSLSTGTVSKAVYSGTCGNLTQLWCGNILIYDYPALAGETIYVRVWRQSSALGNDFSICVIEADIPSNDLCANAQPLNITSSCNMQAFTVTDAIGEIGSPAFACQVSGGDVWFTLEVPESGSFDIDFEVLTAGQLVWTLYSGVCGSMSSLACNTQPQSFDLPAMIGETLYLRVWRNGSFEGMDFEICVYDESIVDFNDNCSEAWPIEVGTSFSPQNYTTDSATSETTSIALNPSCGFYLGADVWFTFQVPVSGIFRIETAALSAGTPNYQLYSGICGSFSPINCNVAGSNYNLPALSGEILYLRVFRVNSTQAMDFSLCIWEPNAPSNDFCANAIAIPVGSSCNPQNFTCQFSTNDRVGVAPNPTCGFYDGGDVWFTFEVPASGEFRVETASLTTGNLSYQIYSGSCGNFGAIQCGSAGTNFNQPALSGETLYLRVFRVGNNQGLDFSLCIWETNVPSNDFCANAIAIPVGSSCNAQNFTCQFSTNDGTVVAPNPTCGFYDGGDVWFTFEVPASGGFRIESTSLSSGSVSYQLYNGSCGNFTNVACAGGNTNFNNTSLSGQTLYLRVFRFANNQGLDFSLCIYEIPVHPNDNCSGAIDLTVGTSCSMQTFSSIYQTTETGIAPNPGCVGYSGGDVWFKFIMPTSGKLRVERNNIEGINAQFALYTGTCGSFSNLTCAQLLPSLNVNNPSLGGQEIYLRVYNYGSDAGGTFELCLWEPPTPDNDMCAEAIHLPVGLFCEMQMFSNAYCTAEPGIAPNPSCVGYSGGDIWFTFDMPESGEIQIERNNILGVNAQWAIYQGTCGDFSNVACAQLVNQLNVNNPALGGETLYLRVYNYGSAQGGTFEICITDLAVPENDFCANAIELPVGTSCEMQEFSNINCTAEISVNPSSDCLGYSGGDVWFTVVMPASGRLRIERNNVFDVNAQMALYEGGCSDFSEVACAQLTNVLIVQDSSLAAQTLYLRVFNYGSAQGGVFELCAAEADCNGDADGTAYYDGCGTCVEGNTGLNPCEEDCNGVFGGSAYLDDCEICVGGNTGLEACLADCNGDYGGTAFLDDCEICVGGNTGLEPCGDEIPLTQLQLQFCDGTYDFVNVVQCYGISGAQDYRWELTPIGGSPLPEYTRGYANRNLRIGWVQGIALDETYEVRVKVKVGGEWGNYGPTCLINTGELTPPTQLVANYSPTNPATGLPYVLCNNIVVDYIYQAQMFEWELTGPNTLITQSPNYFIQLASIPGIQMNTIYQVRVRVLVDGQWGSFGVQLPIQIGNPANTQIIASQCGTTRALNQAVAAINTCGATAYTFRFQHATEAERILVRTPYTCPLWLVTPALTPGETYQVSVKVTQGGVDGDYSTVCDITIAGPQAEGLADDMLVSKVATEGGLGIYPNPNAGSEVRVELNGIEEGAHHVEVTIYDIYGKLMTRDVFGHQGSELSRLVRFEHALATGMYLVHVTIDGENFATEKMVVK